MTKTDIAVVLALLAALASALGDVVRQRSAQEITDKQVGHLELFRMSVRDAKWWLGAVGAIANYVLQAAALVLGSVMMVTALQVTALLFALPIYAHMTRRRVTRWEWTWAVLLAAALAVVVTVGDPDPGASRGSLGTWLVVALVMGPALIFCVVGARIWSGAVVGGTPGGGRRFVAGVVRGVDQGRRPGGPGRCRRVTHRTGVLCLDRCGAGRNDLPAVVIPGRFSDCLIADVRRGQARWSVRSSGWPCWVRRWTAPGPRSSYSPPAWW